MFSVTSPQSGRRLSPQVQPQRQPQRHTSTTAAATTTDTHKHHVSYRNHSYTQATDELPQPQLQTSTTQATTTTDTHSYRNHSYTQAPHGVSQPQLHTSTSRVTEANYSDYCYRNANSRNNSYCTSYSSSHSHSISNGRSNSNKLHKVAAAIPTKPAAKIKPESQLPQQCDHHSFNPCNQCVPMAALFCGHCVDTCNSRAQRPSSAKHHG